LQFSPFVNPYRPLVSATSMKLPAAAARRKMDRLRPIMICPPAVFTDQVHELFIDNFSLSNYAE
jgi:hypothetical protein